MISEKAFPALIKGDTGRNGLPFLTGCHHICMGFLDGSSHSAATVEIAKEELTHEEWKSGRWENPKRIPPPQKSFDNVVESLT
jgi:hypothetical protein